MHWLLVQIPPQQAVPGLQQVLPQHVAPGLQHRPGVYWHGTVPFLLHAAVAHLPFTQVWFEAQQTPLQQTGLVRPQKPFPHGLPYAHWPL